MASSCTPEEDERMLIPSPSECRGFDDFFERFGGCPLDDVSVTTMTFFRLPLRAFVLVPSVDGKSVELSVIGLFDPHSTKKSTKSVSSNSNCKRSSSCVVSALSSPPTSETIVSDSFSAVRNCFSALNTWIPMHVLGHDHRGAKIVFVYP